MGCRPSGAGAVSRPGLARALLAMCGMCGQISESLHPWGAVGGRVRGTTQPIWNDCNSLQHFTQSCGFQQSRPS